MNHHTAHILQQAAMSMLADFKQYPELPYSLADYVKSGFFFWRATAEDGPGSAQVTYTNASLGLPSRYGNAPGDRT